MLDVRPEYPRVTVDGDAGDLGLDVAIDPDRVYSSTTKPKPRFNALNRHVAVEGRAGHNKEENHDANPSTQDVAAFGRQRARSGHRRPGRHPGERAGPRLCQTQTMHWLRWSDFVPASDVLLKGEIAKLCEKDLGMKLTVETINANDIQARITAAIQSGSGPDIFMTVGIWPQLYADSCVDVSDVAEDLDKAQGGFYDACKVIGTVGNKWIGLPWCIGGGLVAYRKSWLAEVGAQEFPKNWDDYRAVGKKLKAAGRPYGQTAGHTFGDAPGWWYLCLPITPSE
ncbi:MAG TPA: extracellular solute-binding protein, partial [Steroidobacteraceae bacterium]|nr:extracellular solute-binding protein [Steroidobacteraceae bacterium]